MNSIIVCKMNERVFVIWTTCYVFYYLVCMYSCNELHFIPIHSLLYLCYCTYYCYILLHSSSIHALNSILFTAHFSFHMLIILMIYCYCYHLSSPVFTVPRLLHYFNKFIIQQIISIVKIMRTNNKLYWAICIIELEVKYI